MHFSVLDFSFQVDSFVDTQLSTHYRSINKIWHELVQVQDSIQYLIKISNNSRACAIAKFQTSVKRTLLSAF